MSKASCNCIVCAQEFDPNELQSVALSKINITNFKICLACFDISDPVDDYFQARKIVNSYLESTTAKNLFGQVQDILDSRSK